MQEDKELNLVLKDLSKRFGDGAVRMLGEIPKDTPVISTGILPIDVALDIGGLPKGRIIELYGHEASGKTTICQYIVAEAQRQGGRCAYVDMEHALDPAYAELCGVDVDALYLAQPDSGEEALEIAEALVRSGKMSVVVVDSVAALVSKKELEGDMGDAVMGMQARLMSQALRKLSGVVAKTNTILIFTNQIRQKIGVMFGNPETTPGGLALKFYASVRMEVRKGQTIKEGNEQIGNEVNVKVVKNKVGRPFRKATFSILYNTGVDKASGLFDLAKAVGVLEQRGAFVYYKGEQIARGRAQALVLLRESPAMFEEIRVKSVEASRKSSNVISVPVEDEEEDEE